MWLDHSCSKHGRPPFPLCTNFITTLTSELNKDIKLNLNSCAATMEGFYFRNYQKTELQLKSYFLKHLPNNSRSLRPSDLHISRTVQLMGFTLSVLTCVLKQAQGSAVWILWQFRHATNRWPALWRSGGRDSWTQVTLSNTTTSVFTTTAITTDSGSAR